jgi:hypothetical protein
MNARKPLVMSLGSGAVWALIGLAVGLFVNLWRGELGRVVIALAGGMIAAPLIGLLMGQVSRVFGYIEEVVLRIIVAGASLYAASVLFLMASFLLQSIRAGHLREHIWIDSFGMASWAFELTFIVLWPLAYVNHTIISLEWARRAATTTKPLAG